MVLTEVGLDLKIWLNNLQHPEQLRQLVAETQSGRDQALWALTDNDYLQSSGEY